MSGWAVTGALVRDILRDGNISQAIERLGVYVGALTNEQTVAGRQQRLEQNLAGLTAELDEYALSSFNAASASDVAADGLGDLSDAAGDAVEPQTALARALGLTNVKLNEQIAAVVSLYEEKLALIDPVYAAIRAQRDYESSLSDLVELEEAGKRGTREYAEALVASEIAYYELQAANAEAGVSMGGYIGTLNEAILAGRLTVEQVGYIVDALNAQGAALDMIDGRVVSSTTHVHTTVITRRAFEGPPDVVNPGDLQFRARGGPVTVQGQPYIVGEEGPELIDSFRFGRDGPVGTVRLLRRCGGSTWNVHGAHASGCGRQSGGV
jgi:hypothetical protein